jgi:hypothetical protein
MYLQGGVARRELLKNTSSAGAAAFGGAALPLFIAVLNVVNTVRPFIEMLATLVGAPGVQGLFALLENVTAVATASDKLKRVIALPESPREERAVANGLLTFIDDMRRETRRLGIAGEKGDAVTLRAVRLLLARPEAAAAFVREARAE